MFNKTAIAFGLAIVAGTAVAAPTDSMDTSANANVSANASTAGMNASAGAGHDMAAHFKKLDTDGNGVLSMSEAQANPTVAKLYESLKTNESIKTDPATGNWICDEGDVGGVEPGPVSAFDQLTPAAWPASGRYTAINGGIQQEQPGAVLHGQAHEVPRPDLVEERGQLVVRLKQNITALSPIATCRASTRHPFFTTKSLGSRSANSTADLNDGAINEHNSDPLLKIHTRNKQHLPERKHQPVRRRASADARGFGRAQPH